MCGRPSTTIGFERLFNPLARLERGDFLATVSAGIPARPLNMVAIEATNRGEADQSWAMPLQGGRVPQVDVDTLERALQHDRAYVLDVREPEEYDTAHVPGAINIPQAELASRLDRIPRDRPLYAICQGGFRSRRAAQFLRQVGFESVVNVDGGTSEWMEAGKAITVEDPQAASRVLARSQWTHAGVHAGAA
jgi:rhodanese-related sulfurtransferase